MTQASNGLARAALAPIIGEVGLKGVQFDSHQTIFAMGVSIDQFPFNGRCSNIDGSTNRAKADGARHQSGTPKQLPVGTAFRTSRASAS